MRHRPVSADPRAIPEQIGLHADADEEGVVVQWDRRSRPIVNADRAILYIEDGSLQSQLDLTGRQLDGSSVRYWPETRQVNFRLEVYRGSQRSSESTALSSVPPVRKRRRQAGPARAIVENTRPSPFERVAPEIVESQALPAAVMAGREPEPEAAGPDLAAAAEPAKESKVDRVLSKIPLLRRFRKHPLPDGNAQH